MRRRGLGALLFLSAGAVAVGCTTSGSDDAGAELGASSASLGAGAGTPGGGGTLALLRVERTASNNGAVPRVVTNAKVARYAGFDASSVLKLLGADTREGDSCTTAARLDDIPIAADARLEFLSIGPITLRAGTLTQTLAPRLFPDLATTASGWFYVAETELTAGAGDEQITLSSVGREGIGRFELRVSTPSELLGAELAGSSLDGELALLRSQDAELTWEPEDVRDRVELELYAGGSVLSCSVRDSGRFVLSASKLAGLEADAKASLVVRRVHVVESGMQGVETAYVRAATSRIVTVDVR